MKDQIPNDEGFDDGSDPEEVVGTQVLDPESTKWGSFQGTIDTIYMLWAGLWERTHIINVHLYSLVAWFFTFAAAQVVLYRFVGQLMGVENPRIPLPIVPFLLNIWLDKWSMPILPGYAYEWYVWIFPPLIALVLWLITRFNIDAEGLESGQLTTLVMFINQSALGTFLYWLIMVRFSLPDGLFGIFAGS